MAGYTRNDTPNNIADGNIINASDLDGEFDAIQTAFGTAGHTHDGTAGNGPQITTGGLANLAVTDGKIANNTITGGKINTATTITAANFVGPLQGNADTATKLQTARNIALTGAVTGNVNFDGSGNVSIATTHTADPVITLTGAVTGSGTMTNLGSVSIATTATADPTLTLTGDVTGSATFTNLGNATLTAVVANDSHTHDGRYYTETESDARFVNTAGDTMTGNLVIDAGTSSSLNIISDDAGQSVLNLYGASQGTGRIYVGQDVNYGGGIEYNGDNLPSTTGAGSDYVTLWRRNAGVDSWTARNQYSSDNWEFRGNLYANTTQRVFADDYHPNADTWTTARQNTVTLTGDVTGSASASVNGSGDWTVSVAATVANDSHTHDGRYYTEAEADSRFANVTGDTFTGNLYLSYSYPRIFLNDTDSNSDYSIINNNGQFTIYDDTNGAHRFSIHSSGSIDVQQNDIINGNSIYMDNWYRSTGTTGWYSQTYGGGIYMTDTTYLQVYANKAFKVNNTSASSITTAGGIMIAGTPAATIDDATALAIALG